MPVFQDDEASAVERTAPLPVIGGLTGPAGADPDSDPDSDVDAGRDVATGPNPFEAPRPVPRSNPFDGPNPFDAPNPFDRPVLREPPDAAAPQAAPPATSPAVPAPVGADPVAGSVPPPPSAPPATPAPSTGWTSVLPVVVPHQPPSVPAPGAGVGTGPVSAPAPVAAPLPPLGPTSAPVAPGGLGAAPRGRILVVEGGYGTSGRRSWGRGGANQAPVLSAMLAAVSPQMLLAADAVDAVHLPGANDPQTVLAHLRAASRHPGPLLVHFGGHLVADRRDGQLYLTLRDSRAGDGLPWQAVVTELQHRSPEWQTLVIADLSADQHAWPQLQSTISPLADGIPLWAVVSPDPEQIGTFTRALIEALHGGRPGAEAVLAPEQLRQQVYSVLRPDVVILTSHAPDRPVFRNTARRTEGAMTEPVPYEGPRPVAVQPRPAVRRDVPATPAPTPAPAVAAAPRVRLDKPGAASVAPPRVSLAKAGSVPPQARPAVTLAKPAAPAPESPTTAPESPAAPDEGAARSEAAEPAAAVRVTLRKARAAEPLAGPPEEHPVPAGRTVTLTKSGPESMLSELSESVDADPEATAELPLPVAVPDAVPDEVTDEVTDGPDSRPAPPLADYREAIGRIVRSADAGEHEAAAELALELERRTVAAHGPTAAQVLQVRQVRAHVSRLAGRPGEAADLYREVALVLLRAEGAEHAETQQAATNAEACWRAIADRAEALKVAPEIIELRAYLPGPDGRKLRAAERYLAQLAATPSVD